VFWYQNAALVPRSESDHEQSPMRLTPRYNYASVVQNWGLDISTIPVWYSTLYNILQPAQVTMGSVSTAPFPTTVVSFPFCAWPRPPGADVSKNRPRLRSGGISFFASRAFASAQARKRTSFRIRASLRHPWACSISWITLCATSMRSWGSIRAARGGARFSGGKIRRAIVRSRSSRNSGEVGARGAR